MVARASLRTHHHYLRSVDDEVEASEEGESRMIDQLVSGTLHDKRERCRTVTSTFEDGTSAPAFGHCLYYDHFVRNPSQGDMPTMVVPADKQWVLEMMEAKAARAEMAVADINMFTPHRMRTINPRHDELIHRLVVPLSQEAQVEYDRRFTRHVDTDAFEARLQRMNTEQEETIPVMARPVAFHEPHAIGVEGAGDRLYGLQSRLEYGDAVIPYTTLAAYLLDKPTDYIRRVYREDPSYGSDIQRVLEHVSSLTNEDSMGDDEWHVMESLVQAHLDEMELTRVFDPMMIQFVKQGDPRHLAVVGMRDTYEKVYRVVCGYLTEMTETLEEVIFPLALRVRDRQLPITVENVIGELDSIMHVKEVIEHMRATSSGRLNGTSGVQEYFDVASPEEKAILDSVDKTILNLLLYHGAEHARVFHETIVIGENDIDDAARIAETMFGPRRSAGSTDRPDCSGGNYGHQQMGTRSANPIPVDIVEGQEGRQQHSAAKSLKLYYSPYIDSGEVLRRTSVRKFRPPV